MFSLINDLNDIVERNAKGGKQHTKEIEDIVSDLSVYCENHFATEEEFMRKIHYPQLAEHKKLHEEFTVKIQEFENSFFANETEITNKLCNFLTHWLYNHIEKEDMLYAKKD